MQEARLIRQSDFLVHAPVRDGQTEALRAFLAGYCSPGQPGHADPGNAEIAFGRVAGLHNIRAFLTEDPSLADRRVVPRDWPEERVALVLLGCCDGSADALLAALAGSCAPWLRALFMHCEGFGTGDDVLAWLRGHRRRSLASYVNGPGRTVISIAENARLLAQLRAARTSIVAASAVETAAALRRHVHGAGITLTPEAPTPAGARLWQVADLFGVPLALVAVLALAVRFWWLALPLVLVALWWLRRIEARDALVVVPPDPADIAARSAYEDHDSANPFTAIGTIKPGWFRMALVLVTHALIGWAALHVFTKGRLGRVGTIHFARWVLIDGGRRVIFTSEYDGSAEAYMDDFINKVGFGLNLSFTNGIGYPRTKWLVLGGASDEQRFKYFMRHHQIITQLWWRAYPGQTTFDLARAARVRAGFDAGDQGEAAAARWLAEIGA